MPLDLNLIKTHRCFFVSAPIIGSIQSLLGHKNQTTTEICLHSISESERETIKVFDELEKKSHTDSHTDVK